MIGPRMDDKFIPIVTTRATDPVNLKTLSFSRFQGKRFVVTIRTDDVEAKVLQIFFHQTDGTLFIGFPYVPSSKGFASVGHFSPFLAKQNVSLEEAGKLTTKRVKYSHHPDGRAHFSQDQQIRTEISKDSIPLNQQDGHIFTAHLQGLDDFQAVDPNRDNRPPSRNRTVLNFKYSSPPPSAFKLTGAWHEVRGYLRRSASDDFGPTVGVQTPEGVKTRGFLIGTLVGSPLDNYALLLTCQPHEPLDESLDPHFLFVGGFDNQPEPLNPYGRPGFLCIQYPVSDFDELVNRLGSLDIDTYD